MKNYFENKKRAHFIDSCSKEFRKSKQFQNKISELQSDINEMINRAYELQYPVGQIRAAKYLILYCSLGSDY